MTTDKDPALPPLPEPDVGWVDGTDQYGYATYDHAYSAEQMKAYGQASREQALWQAKDVCAAIAQPDAGDHAKFRAGYDFGVSSCESAIKELLK